MKAVITEAYGAEDVMQIQDVSVPDISENELLIKIDASSVNPIDWKVRRGDFKIITGKKPPLILGGDFAGVVEKTGAALNRYSVGDKVWGHKNASKGGAYAEYIAVKENNIDTKPESLTFEEAASFPLAGLTAYQALVHKAKVKASDHVLINGCTGGVGAIAVQIAKALRCTVTGVCSGKNVALARQLGCDHVIDYKQSEVLEAFVRFDVVLDAVGNIHFANAREIMGEQGRYVTTVPSAFGLYLGARLNFIRSQKYFGFLVASSTDDLAALRKMADDGALKPMIENVYPISQVRKAHAQSMRGRVVGKIVLKTGSEQDW